MKGAVARGCLLRHSGDPAVSQFDGVTGSELPTHGSYCASGHIPRFEARVMTGGRWFVSVITGHGPDSHVGDFATVEGAKNLILTKAKYWPSKPNAPV